MSLSLSISLSPLRRLILNQSISSSNYFLAMSNRQFSTQFQSTPINNPESNNSSKVYSWGYGSLSGLGNGSFNAQPFPQPVSTLWGDAIVSTSSGWSDNLCINNRGSIYHWGYAPRLSQITRISKWARKRPRLLSFVQQFHLGSLFAPLTLNNAVRYPTPISGFGDFSSVGQRRSPRAVASACGSTFNLLLDDGGLVYSWGYDLNGGLGHPIKYDNALLESPTQIETLKDQKITQIACGFGHSMFLDSAGSVWVCGAGRDGVLGSTELKFEDSHQMKKRIWVPTRLKLTEPDNSQYVGRIIQIAAGMKQSFILNEDGIVFGSGRNHLGQLGTGDFRDRESFQRIQIPDRIVKIAVGQSHTLALSAEGNLWSWGLSDQGQTALQPGLLQTNLLGAGRFTKGQSFVGATKPQQIKMPSELFNLHQSKKIVDIAAGFYDSAVIFSDGGLILFGGRLLRSGNEAPQRLFPHLNVKSISFGYMHALIVAKPNQSQSQIKKDLN